MTDSVCETTSCSSRAIRRRSPNTARSAATARAASASNATATARSRARRRACMPRPNAHATVTATKLTAVKGLSKYGARTRTNPAIAVYVISSPPSAIGRRAQDPTV
ncbi:hypothetical protein GCM10022255_068640 [Dactylosporangium darangshiense]|uniref:Uncharacterized protein n=2 Tax=Dactylosporangium darangshiense TaxID=579108 RepID=A0ABP8DI28_9ACTN